MRTRGHTVVVTQQSQVSHAVKHILPYCPFYSKLDHNSQNNHHHLNFRPLTHQEIVRWQVCWFSHKLTWYQASLFKHKCSDHYPCLIWPWPLQHKGKLWKSHQVVNKLRFAVTAGHELQVRQREHFMMLMLGTSSFTTTSKQKSKTF